MKLSDGTWLYNRCHLIALQLGGDNDKKNLITGTRKLNELMIPYENRVADYVKKTNYHVLYRVTPKYNDDEIVARGLQIEAFSIEDKGKLQFNIYIYNIQDGIKINYKTGETR